MSRTLILVKPDAFERGLTGEMIARFERKGLRIAALKLMQVDRDLAEQHYGEHSEQAVLPRADRVHHPRPAGRDGARGRGRGPGRAPADRGDQPARGAPGSIRGDFALEVTFNLVHGSDSTTRPSARSGCGSRSWVGRRGAHLVERRPPHGARRAMSSPLAALAAAERDPRPAGRFPFEVVPADVEESEAETPRRRCERARARRARWPSGPARRDVLGVDTEVLLDGGPARQGRRRGPGASHLAGALSGRTHEV